MKEEKFEFGKNWGLFLKNNYRKKLVTESANYIARFLGLNNFFDKKFIDVGSGSGLHSEAALELGSEEVMSIDVDKEAINCCEGLRANNKHRARWKIRQGSVLDKRLVEEIGQFDVVYCWGVAHHTGNMWAALDNLYHLAKIGGFIYIAIYNKVGGRFGSSFWYKVKRFYVKSPIFIKKIMEWSYLAYSFSKIILHLKNPFKFIDNYYKKRGMSWKTDMIDWLGGYPYEYCTVEDILLYYKDNYKMTLENLKTTNGIGCNQFLFKKQ